MLDMEFLSPDNYVHPRQHFLMRRLLQSQRGGLCAEAETLIREAIREYQDAFSSDIDPIGPDVCPYLSVEIPEADEEFRIPAGTNTQIISTFVGRDEMSKEDLRTHTYALLSLKFPPELRVPIYPDFLRYVRVNRAGNSRPVGFLFAIPENLSGSDVTLNLEVINGRSLIVNSPIALRVI